MGPISPGKEAGPPRRRKQPTQTTKAHRFEPFTKRIARLRIDPVHTVQTTRIVDSSNDLSQSFFRSALEEWSELNLSHTFTTFYAKVHTLCESLPQLLHHANTIATALFDHVEKNDPLALEPLLSLVAHFAHDLGQSFERYFERAVTITARIPTTQEDPAVVEWCFTCLAWMYKYLSKLLVNDLRPLLDIVLPHFSARKDHMRRFTAESVAFLVRKAATLYPKNKKPLEYAVRHVFDKIHTVESERDRESIRHTISVLLAESAIGVDAKLHSSAADLFTCAINLADEAASSGSLFLAAVQSAIINLIHRTDASGFRPLQDLFLTLDPSQVSVPVRLRLLSILVLTRRGTRVTNWAPIATALIATSDQSLDENRASSMDSLLTASAAVLQYSPLNQLLPHLQTLLKHLARVSTTTQFFSFSDLVSQIERSRFDDLLLPFLQQYIQQTVAAEYASLCLHIQKINSSATQGSQKHIQVPSSLSETFLKQSTSFPSKLMALHLTRNSSFPTDATQRMDWSNQLQRDVRTTLLNAENQIASAISFEDRVMSGWGFQSLLALDEQHARSIGFDMKIMASDRRLFSIVPFVQACTTFFRGADQVLIADVRAIIQPWLIENLRSDTRELQKTSLDLLIAICQPSQQAWFNQVHEVLLEILETQYSISNSRQLAMLVRKLPFLHKSSPTETVFTTVIPNFCLGLLPSYHDQLRRDVCEVLSQVISNGAIEDLILQVVREWLETPNTVKGEQKSDGEGLDNRLTAFHCSNVLEIQSIWQTVISAYADAPEMLSDQADAANKLHDLNPPSESRIIALQTLLDVPELAEKRSKIIVPAFLAAQRGRVIFSTTNTEETSSDHTITQELDEQGWSIRERKLFLSLFSKFQNPKVLYRQADVHAQLLELLQNGDPEIRKLSLLALLKWKDRALVDNQEALLKMAEDKASTVELGSMLHVEDEANSIKRGSREDILPILLRLVFGLLTGRVGVAGSQESRRKALLRLLFRMSSEEVDIFLSIAVGRLRDVVMVNKEHSNQLLISQDVIALDQQYGFLRMALSMIEILQTQFAPYGAKILDAVLYCTTRACYHLHALSQDELSPSLVRNIRRTGIQVLNLLFKHCSDVAWPKYMTLVFEQIINPRLNNFAIENAQSVSMLLRMFATWAQSHELAQWLVKGNKALLSAISCLLTLSATKDDVKLFVIGEIISPCLKLRTGQKSEGILHQDQLNLLLDDIAKLLQMPASKPLLLENAKVVSELATSKVPVVLRVKVVGLLVDLLDQQNSKLPPHIKGQILDSVRSNVNYESLALPDDLQNRLWTMASGYLDFFKDMPNRKICCQILLDICRSKADMVLAAEICNDLNASSISTLDEVDHEKTSGAFRSISDNFFTKTETEAQLPVLYNLIFLLRTSEDISIRANALSCLRGAATSSDKSLLEVKRHAAVKILLNAVRKNLKHPSEIARADFVVLLGVIVSQDQEGDGLADMKPLLVGGDEEASFFTNILHIQVHRRARAIKRLTDTISQGSTSADHIAEYLLPLVESFVEDETTDASAQTTKGQSIAALAVILRWLDWKTFRKVLRHYKQGLDITAGDSRSAIRLLGHAADALDSAAKDQQTAMDDGGPIPHLALSLPAKEVLAAELKTSLIPRLTEFSHFKDEEEISVRLPAAVVANKFIRLLSTNDIIQLASPIVLDVAQILRSRTQETRDMARKILAEIVTLLGASSIQFVLSELRTALTQGYQLHVLSFTLHTILLVTADTRQPGDLDYCIEDLVKVIMDDVFGVTGQEKDNQDYISSMKEVKSSKSFDSMEILAQNTNVAHLAKLVLPFESLLTGSLTTKQLRHADDLLRRIGVGISHNPRAGSQDLLVFSFELVQTFYKSKPQAIPRPKTNDERNRERFLVQVENAAKTITSSSSTLLYKLAKFAIDIARSAFARHSELMKPENVQGFLPILGDALVDGQTDVKVSALRLLATVIKLPLQELDENAKLYVIEAVKVVKSAISTNEEASQAALKLVSAIIRDRRSVDIRESDIAYLLKRTMPDLEEPDRQGVTFNLVKAIMARKMQMPEVYELVDKIGSMMVTSQSRSSREAARGVYVHFLLDYPQSKTRWSKQMKFLLKNLEYQYSEGRQCVMEAASVLLTKLDTNTASEFASVLFVPVILRMGNDDNERCREMAGALLSQVLQKTSEDHLEDALEPLRAWLGQNDNQSLKRISMQAWSKFFELDLTGAQAEVAAVRKAIHALLKRPEATNESGDSGWEDKYQALELLSVLATHFPADVFGDKQGDLCSHVRSLLSSSHSWLQSSATNLLSLFFRECVSAGSISVPLACSHGLAFDTTAVIQTIKSCIGILKVSTSEDLVPHVVQNVLFLARCADASNLQMSIKSQDQQETSGDEISDADDSSHDSPASFANNHAITISATQYILDQSTRILRREPRKLTSATLRPKLSIAALLISLLPMLSLKSLPDTSLTNLLVPLHYLTSTMDSAGAPRSADPTFAATHSALISSAHEVTATLQSELGDKQYIKHITAATRISREKRLERRTKRNIERVADPEAAARNKRKKAERDKLRRKEIGHIHRGRRRHDLGF